jgi:hypothetical protein
MYTTYISDVSADIFHSFIGNSYEAIFQVIILYLIKFIF